MATRPSGAVMPLYVEVGRRIQEIRRAKGLSQERLAAAVGLSRTSITNIEGGRQKLQLHTLSAIATELRVTIHDLIPSGGAMKSTLDSQLPSDVSPKLRQLISNIASKTSAP